MTSRASISLAWAGVLTGTALAFGACNRTDTPPEVYASRSTSPEGGVAGVRRPSAGAGDASAAGSGGSSGRMDSPSGGAAVSEAGSGDSVAGDRGEGASSGSSPTTAGAAGKPGVTLGTPPPTIDCGAAPVSEVAFTREALRAAAGECAMWQYCRAENAVLALQHTTDEYVNEPVPELRDKARDAWREAMSVWSLVELFQFGPLASRSTTAAKDSFQGLGLRERIYSWPTTGRCRVEDQLVTQAYAKNGLDSVLISARGLFALEYLLFVESPETECAATSTTAAKWATLGAGEIAARKHAYAKVLAGDVLEQVRTVRRAWDPAQGNFLESFVKATGYPSEQEALNVLAWALVYVERELKDWKLGIPAGYTLTHPVSGPETPFANTGTENLRQNLRGFRSLFQGCGPAGEGLGFDDWLVSAGHAALAADIVAAWENARAAAEAFPPLHEASAAQVDALYTTVKVLTDLLKGDLLGAGSPLNLDLPAGVEGDTD